MPHKDITEWTLVKELSYHDNIYLYIAKNKTNDPTLLLHTDLSPSENKVDYLERMIRIPGDPTYHDLPDPLDTASSKLTKRLSFFEGFKHANLPEIIDITKDSVGKTVAILEYTRGKPITEALTSAPLMGFLSHFRQVFEAAAFIHKLGALHLHITPNYTLCDVYSGITKIINCWEIHGNKQLKLSTQQITNAYSAPEINNDNIADERSDLYSIALMMLEVLIGYNPFKSTSKHIDIPEIWNHYCTNKYPHHTHMTEPLGQQLLFKLLQENPDDREFKSAKEVVNYIISTWPESAKSAFMLYEKVMTTICLND